ncbi:MAG: 3-oxoacyl-ACP synthase III [Thermodesulfobacteriota bacterium]
MPIYDNVSLHAPVYELPPRVISSTEIEERLGPLYQRLKLPFGRLELMSGIRERRFWKEGTLPSDGAVLAGQKALADAGLDPEEIDCLIFTSVSRDMLEPATASFVHSKLGLSRKSQVFDLSNACLGFLNGMVILANMIELGQIRQGMIVSSETAEDLLESTISYLLENETLTRKKIKPVFASLTIGSGTTALIMSDRRVNDTGHRLKGFTCRNNTGGNNLCHGDNQGNMGSVMATDSEELLKQGIAVAENTWSDFLAETGSRPSDFNVFFCHQVGSAHARQLFVTLGIDPAKNFETLPFLGNTGSVATPITMAMGIEHGKLASGQQAALLGIGSGINCLMLSVEW